MSRLHTIALTIAKGGTESGEADLRFHRVVGIEMPTGWDAADITFKAGTVSGTRTEVQDGLGNVTTLTVVASKYLGLDINVQEELRGAMYLSLVASAAQSTAARTITLVCEPRPLHMS